MRFEIMSDLHIDYWDLKLPLKHQSGERKNFPLDVENRKDILVIAGDISDDLDISVKFLEKISKCYKYILYVDGNHEHVNRYPSLYTTTEINKKITNPQIKYLRKNHFIIDKTVFIGACGWWNYCDMDKKVVEKSKNYFKEWVKGITDELALEFIHNTNKRSIEEFKSLKNEVDFYNKRKDIENIVIVTHTVPLEDMIRDEEEGTEHNTKYLELLKDNKKIKLWIFGHNHAQFDRKINGVRFVSNPRGRPEDYDREEYNSKVISI